MEVESIVSEHDVTVFAIVHPNTALLAPLIVNDNRMLFPSPGATGTSQRRSCAMIVPPFVAMTGRSVVNTLVGPA